MKRSSTFEKCVCNEAQKTASTHFHSNFEMIFVRNGRATIRIEKKEYPLERGALVFLSQSEKHTIQAPTGGYQRSYAILYPTEADKVIGDARLASVFRRRPEGFCHEIDMSANFENIDSCFSRMAEEYRSPSEYSTEIISACLKQILIMAFRTHPASFRPQENENNSPIYAVQRYIEMYYDQEILISQLASENFISFYHLSRSFKKQTGYSPKQYLLYIRLAHAKQLLLETDLPVNDLAFKTGFHDVSNFIRSFRSEYGTTPHKFRTDARKRDLDTAYYL